MQAKTKSRNVTVRRSRKLETKPRPFNALAVVRQMGARGKGDIIIVHPEGSGYGFKIIWGVYPSVDIQDTGNTKQSVVATNFKTYKTKREALGALKKLGHVFHYSASSFSLTLSVYDHNGNILDMKVRTEYKRIWD